MDKRLRIGVLALAVALASGATLLVTDPSWVVLTLALLAELLAVTALIIALGRTGQWAAQRIRR